MSSTFKVGTAGCGVLFVSPDHTGLSVVFPSIFFFIYIYLNDFKPYTFVRRILTT